MLKNRYFSIFAVAGLVSLAACGGTDDDAAVVEETPAVDATAPTMEPMPPMTTDTMAMAPTDTMGMGTMPATDPMVDTTTQP